MNFFIKSATKQLLAYRYGARKGNLNFFENRSLNRVLLSLFDVKGEKSFEKMTEIRDQWTVFYKKRKNIIILYLNRHQPLSVDVKREKYFILNLTIKGFRSLYGAKKIFHSIVGSNGMAWIVRV